MSSGEGRIPDWKKFELLATSIQRDLAPDATVTPNARLRGPSGTERQIDILIEDKSGQYDLRIAMDCKDYKHPVDLKHVETFLGLVEDVGANKGAIVAANGFTASAKKRASDAGLDLFRLIDTTKHKWRSYVSIPAVLRDFQLGAYNFSISGKGYCSIDIRADLRFLPILRANGSLIDFAYNLVLDRWEDGTIPVIAGEYRSIPLTSERTFLKDLAGRSFEVDICANIEVKEIILFGQMPVVEIRGFRNELSDVTHAVKGFTTAPWNFEKIGREWQKIESTDQLSVSPVMGLSVTSTYPRYEPLGTSGLKSQPLGTRKRL